MNSVELSVTPSQEEKRFLLEAALLMRDADRLDEAKDMFEAIVPMVQDKHLPVIGTGTIHFARGEFDDAVEMFEKAVELKPDSAIAYAHLGEALAFAKQTEEAELALKKATELDPGGKDGGEMARTIQKFLTYGLL